MEYTKLVEHYKKEILFFLSGLILVLLGFFLIGGKIFEKSKVEILEQSNSEGNKGNQVVVEIAGAIQNPGVYKLESESRVEDLIQAAGGLSESANQDWVERFINRAAKLSDGQKIYIPSEGEQLGARSDNNGQGGLGVSGEDKSEVIYPININTASAKELTQLWGIGPVTAQKIIDNRPYSSVEELLTKKILKSNVYERNKDKLSVY